MLNEKVLKNIPHMLKTVFYLNSFFFNKLNKTINLNNKINYTPFHKNKQECIVLYILSYFIIHIHCLLILTVICLCIWIGSADTAYAQHSYRPHPRAVCPSTLSPAGQRIHSAVALPPVLTLPTRSAPNPACVWEVSCAFLWKGWF